MLERIGKDAEFVERVKTTLEKAHTENLRNATFEEKVMVLSILDAKVEER